MAERAPSPLPVQGALGASSAATGVRSDAERLRLAQLMARLADGDRSVFDEVFALVHPPVLRLCHRMLPGRGQAEDAAQAALLKLFFQAASYDPSRDALQWALTIAAFECRTLLQRARRTREDAVPADELAAIEADGQSPERQAMEHELGAALLGAINVLEPLDRQTLLALLDENARPPVEGATFRKRVQRAVTRLRQIWRNQYGLT